MTGPRITPFLTFPHRGGRDLISILTLGLRGSCLRRNDEEGRGDDGARITPFLTFPIEGEGT